jgi:hypothetical protein
MTAEVSDSSNSMPDNLLFVKQTEATACRGCIKSQFHSESKKVQTAVFLRNADSTKEHQFHAA